MLGAPARIAPAHRAAEGFPRICRIFVVFSNRRAVINEVFGSLKSTEHAATCRQYPEFHVQPSSNSC
jgi:hypothetical protein